MLFGKSGPGSLAGKPSLAECRNDAIDAGRPISRHGPRQEFQEMRRQLKPGFWTVRGKLNCSPDFARGIFRPPLFVQDARKVHMAGCAIRLIIDSFARHAHPRARDR